MHDAADTGLPFRRGGSPGAVGMALGCGVSRSGRAALLLALLLAGCTAGRADPSVVLITLDTTRVDHLTPYGYERPITPHLEALARESVRFTRVWSPSPWTLPAHASIFTGLLPAAHGARAELSSELTLAAAVRAPAAPFNGAARLADAHRTLAELLTERGYRTAAFAGGPWLEPPFGLMQGFEHVDADVPTVAGRRADELTDAALAWLEGIEPGHPFFLFANYFDPHVPYDPPPGFDDLGRARERFDLRPRMKELLRGRSSLDADERERLVDAYDAEIRFTDFHLGRLLAALRKRPEGDRMLIIVTADHGEAFGEGGRWGHTYWLSQELLHVPLLVRYPQARDAGRVRDDLVQLTDLLPLVAAEVGFAPPARVDGVVPGGRRLGHAQLYRHRMAIRISPKRFDRQLDAAIEWPFLLVRSDRGGRALFRVDGARQRPARAPEVAARLDAALGRPGAEAPAVPASGVDEDTRRALQELGYLE